MIVSSGCGVAWAAKSGEMTFLISSVSSYLSPSITGIFKAGVGMLFPVALAVLAVYDPKHMIKEHIESGADLAVQALLVENAEHHQEMLRQAQKESNNNPAIKESYKQMTMLSAQQAVDSARDRDYSFGLGKTTSQLLPAPQSSVQRIAPPVAMPNSFPALNAPTQPFVNAPAYPANYPPTGTTQQLTYPAPQPAPAPIQKPGLFNWLLAKN